MDRRTGANFIERPIEMPSHGREGERERERGSITDCRQSSTSAWLKLTINYTAQQGNLF